MYGIFTYSYHKSQPNVGKSTIHLYGNILPETPSFWFNLETFNFKHLTGFNDLFFFFGWKIHLTRNPNQKRKETSICSRWLEKIEPTKRSKNPNINQASRSLDLLVWCLEKSEAHMTYHISQMVVQNGDLPWYNLYTITQKTSPRIWVINPSKWRLPVPTAEIVELNPYQVIQSVFFGMVNWPFGKGNDWFLGERQFSCLFHHMWRCLLGDSDYHQCLRLRGGGDQKSSGSGTCITKNSREKKRIYPTKQKTRKNMWLVNVLLLVLFFTSILPVSQTQPKYLLVAKVACLLGDIQETPQHRDRPGSDTKLTKARKTAEIRLCL